MTEPVTVVRRALRQRRPSSSDVWIPDTQPLHFDGSAWTYIDDAGEFRLYGIAGDRRGNVSAVGEGISGGGHRALDDCGDTLVLPAD